MLSRPSLLTLCPVTGRASSSVVCSLLLPSDDLLSTSSPSSPSVILFRKSSCLAFFLYAIPVFSTGSCGTPGIVPSMSGCCWSGSVKITITIDPTTTPGLLPTPDMDADVTGFTGIHHGRSVVGSLAVSELCTP